MERVLKIYFILILLLSCIPKFSISLRKNVHEVEEWYFIFFLLVVNFLLNTFILFYNLFMYYAIGKFLTLFSIYNVYKFNI